MKLSIRSKRSNHPIVSLLQTKSRFQRMILKTIPSNYLLVHYHPKNPWNLQKKSTLRKLKSIIELDLNQKIICSSVLLLNKTMMMKSHSQTQKQRNHCQLNQKTRLKSNLLHRKRKISKLAMKTKNRLSSMELRRLNHPIR